MNKTFLYSLLVLFLLLFVTGCATRTPTYLYEETSFPKKRGFSIQPEPWTNYSESRLNYDALYIRRTNQYVGGLYCEYYRFWPNGRVLNKSMSSSKTPTATEADDFSNAIVGYYKIIDRKVFLEFFVPDPSGWYGWGYLFEKGYLDGNKLIITNSHLAWLDNLLNPNNVHYVYKETPIEGMKALPTW